MVSSTASSLRVGYAPSALVMQNVADLESDRIPWEKRKNHHAYQPAGISKETLESAANDLGRGKTTDPRTVARPIFRDLLQRESKLLTQWAEQQGRLINVRLIRQAAHAFAQRGTEHEVFFDESSNRYIKAGLTGFGKTPRLTELRNDFRAMSALPSEYIQRFSFIIRYLAMMCACMASRNRKTKSIP